MRHFPQLVELQWPEPTVTDGSADLTELNYLDFHYRSHFWNEASRCSVSLKKKKPVLLLIKHRRFGTSYNDRNSHGHNTKRWYLIRFGRCPTGTQIHPLVFSSVVFQPHRDAMEYILFLLHRWIGNPPALIFFIYIFQSKPNGVKVAIEPALHRPTSWLNEKSLKFVALRKMFAEF